MWHDVLKVKYLKKYVNVYIRESSKGRKGVSNCWNCCLQSLNVLIDWLAWNPRRGSKNKVGEDYIVGATRFYKIFEELIKVLHDKGVTFLF